MYKPHYRTLVVISELQNTFFFSNFYDYQFMKQRIAR